MLDIEIQKSERDGRVFFVTPLSLRGRDWIEGWATEGGEWVQGYASEKHSYLGKSLIIRRWEVESVLELLDKAKLNVESFT